MSDEGPGTQLRTELITATAADDRRVSRRANWRSDFPGTNRADSTPPPRTAVGIAARPDTMADMRCDLFEYLFARFGASNNTLFASS